MLVVLLGLGAMVIDLGSAWQHRRQLVTATDGAALAAAQEFASGGDGCESVAADYYNRNAPASAEEEVCTPGNHSVRVDGSDTVQFGLARIFGIDDQVVNSSTTASWEQAVAVKGLRPIGLCLGVLEDLGASPPSPGQEITIPWDNNGPDVCSPGGENVPGSWGYIDFNGGGNAGNEIIDWTENGYDELVSPGTYEPFTGAHGNMQSAIEGLIASAECVALPVYEHASGNGNNARFTVIDFATVTITGVRFTGAPADRYLSFRFTPCLVQGDGAAGGGVDYLASVIAICKVDNSPVDNCPA